MTREGCEVDVQGMEIDRLMRHRLAGVQQGQRTDRLRASDQFLHRGQRAGDIRVMAERNHFHAFIEY